MNLPIGIATAVLALRLVPAPAGHRPGRQAPTSRAPLLVTGGLMLARLHDPRRRGERLGLRSRRSVSARFRSRSIAAFVVRQARIENPLMPLRLFRSRNVSGANIVMSAARGRDVRRLLPRRALPPADPRLRPARGRPRVPAGARSSWACSRSGFTDKLNMRFGPRNVLIAGLFFLLASMLLFARTPVDGHYLVDLFPTMLVFGVGRRRGVPRADDARDVGSRAERRGPGRRPREHHRAGGRRDRPRRARDALRRAHASRSRRRASRCLGAERRLPPRLPDWRGLRGRRAPAAAFAVLRRPPPRRRSAHGHPPTAEPAYEAA